MSTWGRQYLCLKKGALAWKLAVVQKFMNPRCWPRRKKEKNNKHTVNRNRCTSLCKMDDLIANIRNFSRLDFQAKQEVIKNGRPTPELPDLMQTCTVKGQKITCSFQKDWYTRKDWLCGCALKKRLYCFPCLLFFGTSSTSKGKTKTVWVSVSVCIKGHSHRDRYQISERNRCQLKRSETYIRYQRKISVWSLLYRQVKHLLTTMFFLWYSYLISDICFNVNAP